MTLFLSAFIAGWFAVQPVSAPRKTLPVTFPNGTTIEAELAVTAPQRAQGLMFRPGLGPDEGMLFVFEFPGENRFWMKDTLIALDMIWMDPGKRIVHIEPNVPPCKADPCPTYGPGPARNSLFVLEVAAGHAAELGLTVGGVLKF